LGLSPRSGSAAARISGKNKRAHSKAAIATLVATARSVAVQRGCRPPPQSADQRVGDCLWGEPPGGIGEGRQQAVRGVDLRRHLESSAATSCTTRAALDGAFQTTTVHVIGPMYQDSVVINQLGKVVPSMKDHSESAWIHDRRDHHRDSRPHGRALGLVTTAALVTRMIGRVSARARPQGSPSGASSGCARGACLAAKRVPGTDTLYAGGLDRGQHLVVVEPSGNTFRSLIRTSSKTSRNLVRVDSTETTIPC